MSDVKIKINKPGIIGFMKSEEMMRALQHFAINIGDIEESYVGFDRCQVIAVDEEQQYVD